MRAAWKVAPARRWHPHFPGLNASLAVVATLAAWESQDSLGYAEAAVLERAPSAPANSRIAAAVEWIA